MLFNYCTIAFRNLLRYPLFSTINIVGMALSLSSCLLIFLFVNDEMSFDNFHPDGDRTFRVYITRTAGEEIANYPIVPFPFASYMKKDFPEIESTLRLMDTYGEKQFENNGKQIMESHGVYAESSLFDILSLQVLSGDNKHALDEPNSVALTESLALKYFNSTDCIGQTLKINFENWKVTAVYHDAPENFHLKIGYALSMATTPSAKYNQDNWQLQQWFTYIKLSPNTNPAKLEEKFAPFVNRYAKGVFETKGFSYVPHIQNIEDIHLSSSDFQWDIAVRGNKQTVYILSGSGLLILIIAVLNFINLSTARATRRMKEVGIRKVVGARRKQLVFQFLAESVIISFVGLILAIVVAQLALVSVNDLMDKNLELPDSIIGILCGIFSGVFIGCIAGTYPAFYLSRFRPSIILAGKGNAGNAKSTFRESLVVLQFMLSFFLIASSGIILSQMNFIRDKNLGFNKEQLLVVPLTKDQLKDQEVTKRKYMDNPGVISATIGFGLPGDIIAGDEIKNAVDGKTYPAKLFCVDFDYIKTMGFTIANGRDFSPDMSSDSSHAFILNETAVKAYGLGSPEEAIGKPLEWRRWKDGTIKKGLVIGVLKDFNFGSLHEKITPTVLQIYPDAAWKMALRVKPNTIAETLDHLKRTYQSLESRWTFTYNFLDENFDSMYKAEERLSILFSVFSFLAIVVACLGLFGLVEFTVNQRTKEISIRKVFGASIQSLFGLLNKKYFSLLMFSAIVVTPITWYAGKEWLSNFEYRIDISLMIFVKAAIILFLLTIATVTYQSLKSALRNPSDILKSE
jgi:putative ABC transport system permease protein